VSSKYWTFIQQLRQMTDRRTHCGPSRHPAKGRPEGPDYSFPARIPIGESSRLAAQLPRWDLRSRARSIHPESFCGLAGDVLPQSTVSFSPRSGPETTADLKNKPALPALHFAYVANCAMHAPPAAFVSLTPRCPRGSRRAASALPRRIPWEARERPACRSR